MYNANKPTPEELPTSAQLLRSTLIAAAAAGALLVTVVLPAEYGVDPTRVGRILGLTTMGEIKSQLAEEAEMDAQAPAASDQRSSLSDGILGFFVGTAQAQEAGEAWSDEISFTLAPGEGAEWKLVMEEGAVAEYAWEAEGGVVNYDLHGDGDGDGDGQSVSYEKGRGQPADEGEVTAAFAGNHGWFWRNRDRGEVTVTLRLRGDYSELKQTY